MESSTESLGRVSHQQQLPMQQLHTALRILYPILLFFIMISPASCGAKCFNLPVGLSITGHEYRRFRNFDHKECANECRYDPSCFAYEWRDASEEINDVTLCFLKSRSLSGTVERLGGERVMGFCVDEDDELRDRFRDHVVTGPEVAKQEGIEGDDCRDFCSQQPGAEIYSWIPKDLMNDDETEGTCTCIEALRSLTLEFNGFSGAMIPRRHSRANRHS